MLIAVAENFKCACGGCGELPLATSECDMPKGSVEEKNFIREKLAEGSTVEQVIEYWMRSMAIGLNRIAIRRYTAGDDENGNDGGFQPRTGFGMLSHSAK